MTSLKKLLAVAAAAMPLVGSAQTAPAAPPPYQIYGTLNVNFQNATAKDAFDKTASGTSRRAISVDSTNLGIRGTSDVDFGLQLVWQCETTADVSGQGPTGLCNRNSRIGVSHPVYGTLFFGNWDTPYKALTYGTKADDAMGNTDVFGYQDIFASPGFRTVSSAWSGSTAGTLSFDLRAQNSIAYWSPKIQGAWLRLQYTADEQRTFARSNPSGATPGNYGYTLDPYLVSVALNYDFGPFSFAAGYERHYDGAGLVNLNGAGGTFSKRGATAPSANVNSGAGIYTLGTTNTTAHASPSTQDNAWKIGAGWEDAVAGGMLGVQAAVESITYTQDKPVQNSLKEYSRMAYLIGAKYRMGNHEFRARYTIADKGSAKLGGPDPVAAAVQVDTTGYGANSTALGYAYNLSKAAQVYLFYVRIDNDYRATYTVATQGPNGFAAAVPAGSVPQVYGLGLKYGF